MAGRFAALNPLQLQVLLWVERGCPEGEMEGNSFKTVALALQNRSLVKVSKRGGTWRCEITPEGKYYAAHRMYDPRSVVSPSDRTATKQRRSALRVLEDPAA
jgi:hypothetical protein